MITAVLKARLKAVAEVLFSKYVLPRLLKKYKHLQRKAFRKRHSDIRSAYPHEGFAHFHLDRGCGRCAS